MDPLHPKPLRLFLQNIEEIVKDYPDTYVRM